MLSRKTKKKLFKFNCFIIKQKKIWRFSNAFFKKFIIQKLKNTA